MPPCTTMRHQDSWETEAQRRAAHRCTFAVEGAQLELDGYTAVQHSQLERTGYHGRGNSRAMIMILSQQVSVSIVLMVLQSAQIKRSNGHVELLRQALH